ncbi:MAG: hypothetical protein K2I81_03570 [Alphaproteobacteria bacterium]|nr:hypothetical protein [Alphaproteobacteria bacterium]
MTNKDDMNTRVQALAAQLEQMRTDMYKLVDNAILNIARTCAGMSPEMFEEVISSVFHPLESAAAAAAASRPAATKKRPGRKAVWSRSSDKSLRCAYYERRRKGQDIEPELEAELVRRFPTYDAATHTFTGRAGKESAKEKVEKTPRVCTPRPYKDLSNNEIMLKYHSARMAGDPIEDALHVELKRRYPNRYDAQNRVLPDRKKTGQKKKSLRELTDATLKTKYYNARKSGNIPAELNEELARRFPAYNKETREFVNLCGGYRIATPEDIAEMERAQAAKAARRRAEERAKKNAVSAAAKAADKSKATAPVADTVPTSENELVVTAMRTKISQDGVHHDVFVNGKCILRNHIDTQIQVFLNGTILGVYGRVTDIPNLPSSPSWQVYDTNMKRRTFSQVHPFTKKSVYIKNILPLPEDQLSLEVSNKMRIILRERISDRIFRIANESEKQK